MIDSLNQRLFDDHSDDDDKILMNLLRNPNTSPILDTVFKDNHEYVVGKVKSVKVETMSNKIEGGKVR